MRKLHIALILGLAIISGCSLFSKKQNAAQPAGERLSNYILADNFFKDSGEKALVYIISDSANVYMADSGKGITKVGSLYLGDSLTVNNVVLAPFMNIYYSCLWHGRKAYIYGPNLGYKNSEIDFDGDGKPDQIISGYTDYDTTSTTDLPGQHPMWIRFIAANGNKYEVRDSGYSEISVEMLNDSSITGFTRPTRVMDINAGYPACGYEQFHVLVAFRDGKLSVIHKHISNVDSGLGVYYETVLPTGKYNHADTILLVEHLDDQSHENSDSIVTSSLDSSLIYLKGDKWITNTFRHSPADSSAPKP